jgi:hypothetical protein
MNKVNFLPKMLRSGGLLACLLTASPQILAAPVQLTLGISYFPSSLGSPVPPFDGSVLTGTASFFEIGSINPCFFVGIPSVGETGSFSVSHVHDIPTKTTESFFFSFDGLAAGFPAFAFDTVDFPTDDPLAAPMISLGTYDGGAASFEPVVFSGLIVAYDAPVVVGTWNVTVSPVPEPESYAMLLAGLGLLGFATRRRKLKAA